MLLRLAYLGVTNGLTMLRLLPTSDRAKDVGILALRHQITVLQRQLHGEKVRFAPADRALLAALLHRLPSEVRRRIRLLVRPEYERHFNTHRPHRGIANTRPLHPLSDPIADPDIIAQLNVRRRDRLDGLLHEYQPAA